MQRKIPRNIRQIGYANDNEKVYLEDYVDTYLNQLGEKAEQNPEGAFLIGEQFEENGKKQTYLYGAVCMKELKQQGGKISISDEAFRQAGEECERYFTEGSILGWFLALNGCSAGVDSNMIRQHEKYLPRPDTFLLIQDPGNQEENFYVYRKQGFERLSGHYIYYEKNPSMQNYMIDQRRGVGIEPQSVVQDTAAQSFRQILQEKEAKKNGKDMQKLSYTFSAALVLVVLVMGIAAFNNYDSLSGMRSAIRASSSDVTSESTSVRETSAEQTQTDSESEQSGQVQEEMATDGAQSNEAQDSETQDNQDNQDDQEDKAQSETAETTETAETASKTESYYVVKRGDTLVSISRKMYGDTTHVKEICNINDINNGDLIIEGQKILLP